MAVSKSRTVEGRYGKTIYYSDEYQIAKLDNIKHHALPAADLDARIAHLQNPKPALPSLENRPQGPLKLYGLQPTTENLDALLPNNVIRDIADNAG